MQTVSGTMPPFSWHGLNVRKQMLGTDVHAHSNWHSRNPITRIGKFYACLLVKIATQLYRRTLTYTDQALS